MHLPKQLLIGCGPALPSLWPCPTFLALRLSKATPHPGLMCTAPHSHTPNPYLHTQATARPGLVVLQRCPPQVCLWPTLQWRQHSMTGRCAL